MCGSRIWRGLEASLRLGGGTWGMVRKDMRSRSQPKSRVRYRNGGSGGRGAATELAAVGDERPVVVRSRPRSGPLGPRSFDLSFPASISILQTWESKTRPARCSLPLLPLFEEIFQPCHTLCCGTPEPTLLFALMCFADGFFGPAQPGRQRRHRRSRHREGGRASHDLSRPARGPARAIPAEGTGGGRAPCSGPPSLSLSLFCVTASRVPRAL